MENKILDSVEDLVILYSIHGKAVYRNRKALEVLGNSEISPAKTIDGGDIESSVVHGGGAGGENLIKEKAVAPMLRGRATWGTDQPEKLMKLRIPAACADSISNTHNLAEKAEKAEKEAANRIELANILSGS
ncbi:MAG: hypothetical protein K9M94_04340 [Spirochaetia bacterium]|nr:hypothetical protein [Spirochaetia bacterium]